MGVLSKPPAGPFFFDEEPVFVLVGLGCGGASSDVPEEVGLLFTVCSVPWSAFSLSPAIAIIATGGSRCDDCALQVPGNKTGCANYSKYKPDEIESEISEIRSSHQKWRRGEREAGDAGAHALSQHEELGGEPAESSVQPAPNRRG